MSGIKVVFGTAGVNKGRTYGDPKALEEAFDLLGWNREKGNVKTLDTARLYGDSEELLGKAQAGKRFTLDTKARAGFNKDNGASKENVLADGKKSKELLHANVDIYYLHAPDYNTSIESTLAGVDELHKTGWFKRFGLSNFHAEDVQKVYDHCKEKNYVLPTAYQGNYSAVARRQEKELFPTLRKLGIAFYAYSPLAGGFLTKTKEEIQEGAGRFNTDKDPGMYTKMYGRPSLIEALADWEAIAKEEGVSKADLAYRWVKYNSPLKPEHGDAIIIGARTNEQLEQTLQSINGGPLSDKAAKGIDEIWKKIEKEAPLDNMHH